MLIKTKGRSNPFVDHSNVCWWWCFVGILLGACGLSTAQRVVESLNRAEAHASQLTETGPTSDPIPPSLGPRVPNHPTNP